MSPKTARKLGWFRPKGFLIPLLFAGLVVFYVQFFADYHLKKQVERYASLVNGAVVNIGSLKTSLLRGEVYVRQVQIAHHTHPNRNLIEIESIDIRFLWLPLLSGKLVSPRVRIAGIRLFTARDSFGALTFDPDGPALPPGILDRVATGLYEPLRKELGDTPLRKLGLLSTGLGTQARVDQMRAQLATTKRIAEIEKEIKTETAQWEKKTYQPDAWLETAKDSLADASDKSPREIAQLRPSFEAWQKKLLAEREQANAMHQQVLTFAESYRTRLMKLEQLISDDVSLVRGSLGLPLLDGSDFTHSLLGPKLLNSIERVGYWVDVSRRRMPTTEDDSDGIVLMERVTDSGNDIVFGKKSTYPSALLMSIQFASETGTHAHQGKVVGELRNFTTDPPIWKKPTTMELEGDFPGIGIRHIKLNAAIDHTGRVPEEKLLLSVDAFPLTDWILENTPDLKLKVAKADAKIGFEGFFVGNDVSTQWTILASHVEYGVETRFKLMQEALTDAFVPFSSLYASGLVRGKPEALKFELTSNVGKKLGLVLKNTFRHSLAAVDDNIRQNILDQIEFPRRRIREQLVESVSRMTDKYNAYNRTLDEVQQSIQSLSGKKKPVRQARS
jgi:uncharacterized protein (TIGR03545 family)